jgi:hypothetical protein
MILAVALGAGLFAATRAEADLLMPTDGQYAVLIEPGAHNFGLNNASITGNVGIGLGLTGSAQIASNGFIFEKTPGDPTTGQLRFADPTGTVSNAGNVQGGVLFNQPGVTQAINDANALGTFEAAQPGTPLTITGSGQVINASSGMLDPHGNLVFMTSTFSNNNGGITINGTASQFVVININNGTNNQAWNGPISLTGGITSDHVLFNFTGTGNFTASTGGATVNGIFLMPHMAVNVDNTIVMGRIFGGVPNADFQIVSGLMLTAPTFQTSVPEPSPLAISALASALVLGGRAVRRRFVR